MAESARRAIAMVYAAAVTMLVIISSTVVSPVIVRSLGLRLNHASLVLDDLVVVGLAAVTVIWIARRGGVVPTLPLAAFVVVWVLQYWSGYPAPAAFVVGFWAWVLVTPLFAHLALTFPDGRCDRWERAVVWIAYLVSVVPGAARFALSDMETYTECPLAQCQWAPVPVWADAARFQLATVIGNVLFALGALLFLGTVLRRVLRQSPAGRRRYRWMATLCVLRGIEFAIRNVVLASGREWNGEVDTVVAWSLTALLAVTVLLELVGDRWVSPGISRAAHAVEQGTPVRAALSTALADPDLVVAYRAEHGGYVDEEGQPVRTNVPGKITVSLGGEHPPMAMLVHDPAVPASAVQVVAPAVVLAQRNQRLQVQVQHQLDEVRASRARLVEAGDVERRRIERDLHDGAQQRLLGLGLGLRLMRDQAGPSAVLDELLADLDEALVELRNLAHGIHPALLNDLGLSHAIPALLRNCPRPVAVRTLPDRRFPSEVEITAYYVVAEAITNSAKHADAAQISIAIWPDGADLRIFVRDDGQGGARIDCGTGLRGLRDRVEAGGGHLCVTSPAGQGTTVEAVLPCG